MNKLALLINYSENSQFEQWNSETKGMYNDVECMNNYLLSPLGGGWKEDEIKIFHQTNKRNLLNIIGIVRDSSLEYSFVYFSGHGFLQEDELYLEINNRHGEIIHEYMLRNIARRNLIILDCCRKTPDTSSERASKIASILDLSNLDYRKHRNYYEELIRNSTVGNTVLYACGNEECSYGGELGGNYTQKLLRCARRWQESCRNKESYEYLSSYLVHEMAKIHVIRAQAEQHPTIEKARSGNTPPYAVYVP